MLLFYVISKKGDINIGLQLNKDGQKKDLQLLKQLLNYLSTS